MDCEKNKIKVAKYGTILLLSTLHIFYQHFSDVRDPPFPPPTVHKKKIVVANLILACRIQYIVASFVNSDEKYKPMKLWNCMYGSCHYSYHHIQLHVGILIDITMATNVHDQTNDDRFSRG